MNPPASVSARPQSRSGRKRQSDIRLSDEFLAGFTERQPSWGPLGWITYKRTYARWADKAQTRREEWWETVRRVVEGNVNMDPRPRTPEVIAELEAEAQEMFETIFSLAWTPPGRGLWISGTDYARRVGDALINCVSGDTLVHTEEGLVPARDLAGRELPTLSQGGVYRMARWDCYGEQELFRVVFANGDEIEATARHEWVVGGRSGRRVTTLDLVGENVPLQHRASFVYDEESYREGVRHGLIYGDGALNGPRTRSFLRQFGDSQNLVTRFFDEHYTPEWEQMPSGGVTVTSGHPADWKSLPSGDEGPSYIRGFIAGVVAADGHVNKLGGVVLHQSDPQALAAVRRLAASVGLPATSIRRERELNPWTGEPAPNYCLTFVKAGFWDEHMVLKDNHRANMFGSPEPRKQTTMRVVAVERTGRVEPVYCCQEPETHTWVAGPGYLTGNCWFIDVTPRAYEEGEATKPSYPFCFAMDRLMAGGGVGFGVTLESVIAFPPVSNPVSLHVVCDPHHANYRELDADQIPQSTHTTVRVEDSREGWVDALRVLIDAHFKAKRQRHLVVDVSDVRPAGADIKGFGGTSAGPGPLVQLLRAANGVLNDRVGVNLTPVDCTDLMNMVGRAVVAGNVRRSAEIALGSANDLGFISMKQDQGKLMSHRWASNNSIVIDGAFEDFERIASAIAANGEPGIFNLELARTRLRLCDDASDERNLTVGGVNPCAEIVLDGAGESCNLAEIFPAVIEREGLDMERILRLALRYTKRVTCARYSWAASADIVARNRRVGVSLSGVRDWMLARGARELEDLAGELDAWYGIVRDEDAKYSEALGIPTSVAVTTVKPSGCRPWNALTSTDRGILTLEELFTDHPDGEQWADVAAPASALQGSGSSRITRTYDNGASPVLRIKTAFGIEVESTPNHRWWVASRYHRTGRARHTEVGAWVEAAALQPGDVLEIRPGAYSSERHTPLSPVRSRALKMRGDATDIRQPEHMNVDLAWLLGYLWGDGAMSPSGHRIRFIDGRLDNLEKAQRVISEQFGLEVPIRPASGARNARCIDVSSKLLWHWLIRNGVFKYFGDDHQIDLIPAVVRSSSHEDQLAFLAGLIDADGCVAARPTENVVVLSTADEAFAKHVQHVALALGIVFSRNRITGHGEGRFSRKALWNLVLMKMTVPERFALLESHSVKMRRENMRRPELPWSHLRTASRQILGKVEAVEDAGVLPTFDIEVEGTHWYYAGAIKSHNTVSLLNGSSPGLHAHQAPYFIRRIRLAAKDTLVDLIRQCGFHVEDDAYAPNTVVAEFPVKAPGADEPGFVSAGELSLEEQFETQATLQRWWSDNAVSATLTFRKDERRRIAPLLLAFRDQIKSTSLLPYTDPGESTTYVQMPYEPITRERYEEMLAQIICWPHEVAGDLHETRRQEFDIVDQADCVGGACPIK